MQVKPTYEQLENREQWLAALRSGDYQQCKSYLYVPGVGMCCLGVAAHVSGLEPGQEDYADGPQYFFFPTEGGKVRANLLPPKGWIASRYGLSVVGANHIIQLGSAMNDGSAYLGQPLYIDPAKADGQSFTEIADALEWAFAVHDYGNFT
jgi:hypothetical protein